MTVAIGWLSWNGLPDVTMGCTVHQDRKRLRSFVSGIVIIMVFGGQPVSL